MSLINCVTKQLDRSFQELHRNVANLKCFRGFKHQRYRTLSTSPSFKSENIGSFIRSGSIGSSTIYALSTAPYKAAVAVFRISGPHSNLVFENLFPNQSLPSDQSFGLRILKDPENGNMIDKCLVLRFISPKSFTGEDCLEIQSHGGVSLQFKILDTLKILSKNITNLRIAEPGEFALRAFLNEKMTLAQVESLADLLDADSEAERSAISSNCSYKDQIYKKWSQELVEFRGLLEAMIDFGETDSLNSDILTELESNVNHLIYDIEKYLDQACISERISRGFNIAIIGPTNAGKSSLINHLTDRAVSIVSEKPGTTRDIVDVFLNIGNFKVIVSDTAGIRQSSSSTKPYFNSAIENDLQLSSHDSIEFEGIRRAKDRALKADLIIIMIPIDNASCLSQILKHRAKEDQSTIIVLNKVDLFEDFARNPKYLKLRNDIQQVIGSALNVKVVELSCKNRYGIRNLIQIIESELKKLSKVLDNRKQLFLNQRHRQNLIECVNNLKEFQKTLKIDLGLAGEYLRGSSEAIGKINGFVDVEKVLTNIFSRFCIGK